VYVQQLKMFLLSWLLKQHSIIKIEKFMFLNFIIMKPKYLKKTGRLEVNLIISKIH